MKKILFRLTLVALLALCHPAEAQQPKKVVRIGYLTAASLSSNQARIEAFRQGLRELGYVEGKTLSSSIDILRGNSIASARSRRS